ncbi:MAG: SUMF1/EgtB/PvdO family nonheme iron enzyme [Chloroflexota bacterium]
MPESSYFNFDLLIERTVEKYRARVIASPVGPASTEFDLPLSDLELENYILRMGQNRRGLRQPFDSGELQAIKQCGERLFDAVFSGEVYTCFLLSRDHAREQGRGLRIRLHIEAPEFHDYPWELLYNSKTNQFLALSNDTPVVRYFELPAPEYPLSLKPPLRMLVMISSPEGFPSLDVEEEWQKLTGALQPLVERGMIVLERLARPTLGDLQKALRRDDFHIFHFIGHGKFITHRQDGVLLLEEDMNEMRGRPVSGQYLGILLHDHQSLRLVVLNACEGARTSQSDPYAGVAQSLVQQGIPAVIAMQFPIFEDSAIKFANEFYGAIADEFPVDAAMSEARKAIFTTGNETEWATPVLFMNAPDGKIFKLHKEQAETPLPEPAPVSSPQGAPLPQEVAAGPGSSPHPPAPPPASRKTPSKRNGRKKGRAKRGWWVWVLFLALLAAGAAWLGWRNGWQLPFLIVPSPAASPAVAATAPSPTATLALTEPSPPAETPTSLALPMPSAPSLPPVVWDSRDAEMALIPAGEFLMGNDLGASDEQPIHLVYLADFYIDRYEVTNAQYEACVALKLCDQPREKGAYNVEGAYFGNPDYANYPVLNVTWEMADAYCTHWRDARLPTEAEWEKAARGPLAFPYPWSEGIECDWANYRDPACNRLSATRPVTEFMAGQSFYGVYNMAGNVWEWVADWYSPTYYYDSPLENPLGPETGRFYVKRGGGFLNTWDVLESFNRESEEPTGYSVDLGFRCARPVSETFP